MSDLQKIVKPTNPDLKPTPEELKTRRANIKYQRDKDREMVKGIFRNFETRGGTITFPVRLYPGDPIEMYTLSDGETYSLPLGVAKHLNKNCSIEIHEHLPDGTFQGVTGIGRRKMTAVSKIKRFGFQSLEFVDTADLTMDGKPMNEVVGVRLS